MKNKKFAKTRGQGFTIIELLVVISIISLLSSITLVSVNNARIKARDTKRLADLRQLQTALEIYFDTHSSYPPQPDTSGSRGNDCSGSTTLAEDLAGLVTDKIVRNIPTDPRYPNNSWPQCFYYFTNTICSPGDPVHPYIIIFKTENLVVNYPQWGFGGGPNRYCIYPS